MDAHLSRSQMDQLLCVTWATGHPATDQIEGRKARLHLETCEICQAKLRAEKKAMETLAQLRSGAVEAARADCPPGDVWLDVAAGIHSTSENYLSHAAECDHCGPLLNEAVADLAPEDDPRVAALPSSRPAWQEQVAAKLRDHLPSRPAKSSPGRRWRWVERWPVRPAVALALAALVTVAIWLPLRQRAMHSPERLIADAYGEKRTLEVRIEGAPYVPLRQERGATAEQTRMSRPALLKAEAEIAQKLQAHPNDVVWLQASGRANLLEGNVAATDAAVATLEKAHRLAPDDESISIDLASAHIVRGQLMGGVEDYGDAIQILGPILKQDPGKEVAQFNYAIALEGHLFLADAAKAWQTFLTRFPQSAWTPEARDRLARVEQEIRSQQARAGPPLKSLAEVGAAFERKDSRQIAEIENRLEEYTDLAAEQWLPLYFSLAKTSQSALHGLASLLSEKHQDPWLEDLLSADGKSPAIGHAVQLLSSSLVKIEASQEAQAEREAASALSLFRQAGAPAGVKRAELVLVRADQYGHRDVPCESKALAMVEDPSVQRYPWILGQAELEASFCANAGDKRALQAAQAGDAIAGAHAYPTLMLRAAAAESGAYSAMGDTHQAWSAAGKGLASYWNGTYPRLRGYNALIVMEEINFPRGNWFLEEAILKEALPLVENDPRTSMVAVEETRLGQTLIQTGEFDEAEKTFRQAQLLLARSAPGSQRDALSAEAELGVAEVDLRRGRFQASLDRLERIQPTLAQIPDDLLQLDFYQTLGTARLRSHQYQQAVVDLSAAVKLAEQDLRGIESQDDRWKWSRQNEPIYRALVEAELHVDPTQALLDWEWYKGAALRGADDPWLPAAGEKVVSFNGTSSRAAMVSFAVFPQGTAVWIWDGHGIREQWIKLDETELTSLVKKFTDECSDPHSDPSVLHDDGVALYRKVILPIEPSLSGFHRLVLEPDGPLKSLPLGLLVNSKGNYFGDQYAITVSPGLVYLNRSREWTGVSAESAAIILDSTEPGWAPLPDAGREAQAIASSFDHARLLSHDSLSTPDISRQLAQANVFHFAGHADSTALVTGSFDLLNPAQLHAFSRGQTQLVVLSACSTSTGTSGFFDDDDSMVRRLMGARIPEVVASRWMVDSAATASLMKLFYPQLLTGKSASEALETAARTLRTQPGFAHPYYWGSFTVFGRS